MATLDDPPMMLRAGRSRIGVKPDIGQRRGLCQTVIWASATRTGRFCTVPSAWWAAATLGVQLGDLPLKGLDLVFQLHDALDALEAETFGG